MPRTHATHVYTHATHVYKSVEEWKGRLTVTGKERFRLCRVSYLISSTYALSR